MGDQEKINKIMRVWFGELQADGTVTAEQQQVWFATNGPAHDEWLRDEFGEWVDAASQGDYDHWLGTPEGTIALLVLLDQLRRNLFRGKADSFTLDPKCEEIAKQTIAKGWHLDLPIAHQLFLYLPLEHAEDLETQKLSVKLFTEMAERVPESAKERVAFYLFYAQEHHDVIEKYGRFPARNEALGRESTADELTLLASYPTGFRSPE